MERFLGINSVIIVVAFLLLFAAQSRGGQSITAKPKQAKDENSGLLIGGSIALGVLLIILAIALWWYLSKRRSIKEKRKPSPRQEIIPSKAPQITVNKIEFTVPTNNMKQRFWEHDENAPSLELSAYRDKSISGSTDSIESDRKSEGIPTAFGLLRPDLYASDNEQEDSGFPPGHMGRIWFRLEYDCEAENLFVTVINIANLPPRQQRGSSLSMSGSSTCDSFVRIYLLPDEKRYLQTKVKKRTRNPNFHQKFAFSMSYSILLERTLRFSVFDVDRFTRQSIIGHALYSLEDLDITMATEEWQDLEKVALPSTDSNGEILLSLTYLPQIKRIALTVCRAAGLHLADFPSLCPYTKVNHSVMGKVTKSKKTPVHRETAEPHFDFCFEFKINTDVLEQTCFTVEVMHSTSPVLKQDKMIGRIDIGGSLVSRGKGLDHWTDAMLHPNTPVKEWHYLKH